MQAIPIELGRIKGKLRRREWLTIPERDKLLKYGTNDEFKQLKRLDEQYESRFNDPRRVKKMKLTSEQVNKPGFNNGMDKLKHCQRFGSMQTAWHVMKLVKAFDVVIQEQRDLYKKMTAEYVETDEKGNLKLTPQNELMFKTPEGETAHKIKFDEFMKVELEISAVPLNFNELNTVGLTPFELDALEPVIDKTTLPQG